MSNIITIDGQKGQIGNSGGLIVPRCRITNAGALTIANDTYAYPTWDTETFDVGAMHSVAANQSRITISVAGTYLIQAQIGWFASAAGTIRACWLKVNRDDNLLIAAEREPSPLSGWSPQSISCTYYLNAGDYVEVMVYQDSGGDLQIYGTTNSWFSAILIGE